MLLVLNYFVAYLTDLKCNLMEGLPERLPVGQATLKCYLPDLKIYLSRTTGRDFFLPCVEPRVKCNSSYNLGSNSGTLLEPPRGKMLATLGGRAFQVVAPHLWNELPLQLRTNESVEIFKMSIKTFLLRQFF